MNTLEDYIHAKPLLIVGGAPVDWSQVGVAGKRIVRLNMNYRHQRGPMDCAYLNGAADVKKAYAYDIGAGLIDPEFFIICEGPDEPKFNEQLEKRGRPYFTYSRDEEWFKAFYSDNFTKGTPLTGASVLELILQCRAQPTAIELIGFDFFAGFKCKVVERHNMFENAICMLNQVRRSRGLIKPDARFYESAARVIDANK